MGETQRSISLWEKPAFEVINVSMECTAYAATLQATDQES
jgi:coenzyme PQQ precursor peptide PqqA